MQQVIKPDLTPKFMEKIMSDLLKARKYKFMDFVFLGG